jgi:endonuclease/exonuclease/phosphatase family metal-dependent hydrolase
MKHFLLSLMTLTALLVSSISRAQTLTTLTFNIRYDNPDDGKNSWEQRKTSVVALLEHYAPQIFGLQEGLHQQVKYLKEHLGPYNYVGVGREDGKEKGEYSPIFYDTTQYEMISNSTLWLSETPDKVSVGWDAALERICTCALFQHIESGKYLWVFNTHFDHMGTKARQKSAQLILKKINELNTSKYPVVLMGDFNTATGSEPINTLTSQLLETSVVAQKPLYGPRGTFNSFEPSNAVTECIDFVFVSKLEVISCTHIDDKRNDNLCISDHYPVMVVLAFR